MGLLRGTLSTLLKDPSGERLRPEVSCHRHVYFTFWNTEYKAFLTQVLSKGGI